MAGRAFRGRPSYADAVRLLGADEPKIIKALDGVLGSVLGAVPGGRLIGLPFFAFRDELVEWGNKVVRTIRDRVAGSSRLDRTQRLEAAHAVIVVTSFLEVLDADGDRIFESDLARLATEALPQLPTPGESMEMHLERLCEFYYRLGIDASPVAGEITGRAFTRYEENYRRLAAEVPEFAVWAFLTEHRATRASIDRLGGELVDKLDELTTGLAGIPAILEHTSGRALADTTRQELARVYRAAIERPVLSGGDTPDGVALPSLEAAYVNPRCRIASVGSGSQPGDEVWWGNESDAKVQPALAGLLTTPAAFETPIVVLGQPGTGKSVLTKMLAARLPEADFLPVRVELRSVPADTDVQTQIEHALREATGRDIGWPSLAESADGAFPVVMLDGFDELLQATGVNRSDYLEQVRRFQQREADLDRPVVVLVTSRTAVADRARFSEGTTTLRLKPFGEHEVRTWLKTWNDANTAEFARRGIQPLPAEIALRHEELASQPLLLMMLALYDAGDNALQKAGSQLGHAELYERLLTDFARREVRKHQPSLSPEDERHAIETELRRLAIVALAMFNRHAQAVTEAELDRDLAVLWPHETAASASGMHKPLTAAQLVVGRFFFVHESRAERDGEREHAFEFLHATFGEFLVARIVIGTLRELAEEREFLRRRATPGRVDREFFYAITSFTALAGRAAVVEFVDGLLVRLDSDERVAIKDLTIELLGDALFPQPAHNFDRYEPTRAPVTRRHAAYSANLALFAVLSADAPIPGHELFLSGWPPGQLHDHASLWWGQLNNEEWRGMRDIIRVRWNVDDGRRLAISVGREDGSDVRLWESIPPFNYSLDDHVDPEVTHFRDLTTAFDSDAGVAFRTAAFFLNATDVPWRAVEALTPYFEHVGNGVGMSIVDHGAAGSLARLLLELRLAPPEAQGTEQRLRLYRWCWEKAAITSAGWDGAVLRQLREDANAMPPDAVVTALGYVPALTDDDFTIYLDILDILVRLRGMDVSLLETLSVPRSQRNRFLAGGFDYRQQQLDAKLVELRREQSQPPVN